MNGASIGIAVAVASAACGSAPPITISGPSELDNVLRDFIALTPYDGLRLAAPSGGDGFSIEVVLDEQCRECYRIEASSDRGWIVHAGDRLGAQYGVAHALENLGFRFRTPTDTLVPDPPAFDPAARSSLGVLFRPQVTGQRGLQLHTLHPIEAYWALWEPDGGQQAARIFDWVIKNRGNHVQWPALDDIMDPARHAQWQATTAALLDHAHLRGLTASLAIQLFGSGNMQQAFDLSDDANDMNPFEQQLAARFPLVSEGLPFDGYVLSFGEFFGEDPERFLAAVNATVATIRAAKPTADIHAAVHVGADQRVTYRGEQLPYYFLVKYADPTIVSNVHTVMFYNLFEDAGGAYGYTDFSEHRAYLLEQMTNGRAPAYYPESAYWVAFDNSVPLFLPLYVRSRWLDLDGIARETRARGLPPLAHHLVFSSGWEWGYWLNDYASLRASYQLPSDYSGLLDDALAPDLAAAVPLVRELADLQAARLINQRLAPYLAGRDFLIDVGDKLGIHSQPDRMTFEDLAAADAATRDGFARDVVDPLAVFSDELTDLGHRARALGLADSPWSRELLDGFAITAARARFAAAVYRSAVAHLAGDLDGAAAARDQAELAFAEGRAVVTRRHASPHHDGPRERLFGTLGNATVYGYGYLHQADTLCYWERELVLLDELLTKTSLGEPNCWL